MYEGILGVKKPIFGLDIGYQTLKVMQLKSDKPGSHLLGVAEIPIDPKSLTKDGIKDKNKIAEAIRRACQIAKPHPITAKIVSSALPESLVFTKSIDLPKMSEAEINKNVPYQAGEFFPIPPSEMYIDWQIVGELPNHNQVDVLVVAAPKVIVDSIAEVVKLAGLDLSSLETKPVADTRALIDPKDPGPYLLLDIGAKTSSIICLDQGNLKLTSTISSGGDDLAANFQPIIDNLASEIIHLVKYYQNRIGQATIFRKIVLAGGGANVPHVVEALEAATRIKTGVGWPLISTKTYNPKFATVIGLAIKRI